MSAGIIYMLTWRHFGLLGILELSAPHQSKLNWLSRTDKLPLDTFLGGVPSLFMSNTMWNQIVQSV